MSIINFTRKTFVRGYFPVEIKFSNLCRNWFFPEFWGKIKKSNFTKMTLWSFCEGRNFLVTPHYFLNLFFRGCSCKVGYEFFLTFHQEKLAKGIPPSPPSSSLYNKVLIGVRVTFFGSRLKISDAKNAYRISHRFFNAQNFRKVFSTKFLLILQDFPKFTPLNPTRLRESLIFLGSKELWFLNEPKFRGQTDF